MKPRYALERARQSAIPHNAGQQHSQAPEHVREEGFPQGVLPLPQLPIPLQPETETPPRKSGVRNFLVATFCLIVLGAVVYQAAFWIKESGVQQAHAEATNAPKSQPKQKPQLKITKHEERRLMRSALACFQTSNYDCARRYFLNLSNKNSALGTLSLAQTYDPNIMNKLESKDIKVDAKKARELYKRAIQLGSTDAKKFLKNL
jgi:TPR repeat protein